jgi:Outer membrane protein beta-barrel domain
MKIHFRILAIALLSGLLSAPAFALEGEEAFADMHSGPGPYVALNMGKGVMSPACNAGFANCQTYLANVYFATYGFDYTPMWALEATYGKIGNISASPMIEALGLSVEGVGTLHLGDTLAVFAKAGAAYGDFRINGTVPAGYIFHPSGVSPAGGIGLRFNFTPHLSMRVQGDYWGSYGVLSGAKKMNIVTTTIGLMWRY